MTIGTDWTALVRYGPLHRPFDMERIAVGVGIKRQTVAIPIFFAVLMTPACDFAAIGTRIFLIGGHLPKRNGVALFHGVLYSCQQACKSPRNAATR